MGSHSDIFAEFGQNSGYVEELYALYLNDPALVGEGWASYFGSLNGATSVAAPAIKVNGVHAAVQPSTMQLEQQLKASRLINIYRHYGHFAAKVNPLSKGISPLPEANVLLAEEPALSEEALNQEVLCFGFRGQRSMRFADLVAGLREVYAGSIGAEFRHLASQDEREWVQSKMEGRQANSQLSTEQRRSILQRLIEAEGFESELHKTFVGSKRFSIQGGETALPMMEHVVEFAGKNGIKDIVIGMAHRGRLNILAHVVGKPYAEIFSEFEDQSVFSVLGSGDVKYHMGYRSERVASSGAKVQLELAPNPSHLEFVNPVVEGIARARQDIRAQRERGSVLPLLIHGDAAFIGQGIVWETLNMSDVPAYSTAGTFHLVLNNQIGFTTDPEESRSSPYCTEMAKAVQAPIFHVNGEDVEACLWTVQTALEFRQRFGRDVVVDLYCYRKYGHNEGDDPSFTQPVVYAEIAQKKSIPHLYAEELIRHGVLSEAEVQSLFENYVKRFQTERAKKNGQYGEACAVHGRLRIPTPPTGVALPTLKRIASTLIEYPEGFKAHPKLEKLLEKRVETLEAGKGIDWGFAEALAFGSLVAEGRRVRLTGQDCGRGTFSQRHLLLSHYERPEKYSPFSKLEGNGGRFEVYNSTLSEASVVGFEFGYASIAQDALVLWEAQFGDFANGAQVIIDQFIASSEAKWGQLSGIVLLLPHGFEGQGPEHSSARLERFLQLCGEGNMVVAYPSTAAQHFHLMRRQGVMEMKRPLIVMTPKSLLRLPQAAASVDELTSGQFETVLENDFGKGPADRVVFCSGKVFYDIQAALEKHSSGKVKVIRLEQLYPFPQFEVKKALKELQPKKVLWVQEEPQNMGAWSYVEPYMRQRLGLDVQYIGRMVSASPATGSGKRSAVELQSFINEMLESLKG